MKLCHMNFFTKNKSKTDGMKFLGTKWEKKVWAKWIEKQKLNNDSISTQWIGKKDISSSQVTQWNSQNERSEIWLFNVMDDEEDTRHIDAIIWIHEDENHSQQEWKTNEPHPIHCITCQGKEMQKMIFFKNYSFTKVPKQNFQSDKSREWSGNDCHCQFPKKGAMLNSHHFTFNTQNEEIVDAFKCRLKVRKNFVEEKQNFWEFWSCFSKFFSFKSLHE